MYSAEYEKTCIVLTAKDGGVFRGSERYLKNV